MERIASIEIHKDGRVYVTSGDCPALDSTGGDCIWRSEPCTWFDGVKADSDEVPSLECTHPDEDDGSDLSL